MHMYLHKHVFVCECTRTRIHICAHTHTRSHADIPGADKPPTMCVITMVKNEHAKFASFIPYYLGEGADFIYVIDDRSDPPLAYDHPAVRIDHINAKTYSPRPKLYRARAKQSEIIEEGIEQVIFKHDCKWTVSVDVDEFVTTIRNERNTVKEELELSFQEHAVIDIPWVSMAYDRPVNNVLFDMVYRWDHDLPHYQKFMNRVLFNVDVSVFEPINQAVGGGGAYIRFNTLQNQYHMKSRKYKYSMSEHPSVLRHKIMQMLYSKQTP